MAMRNMSVVGVWGTFVRNGAPNANGKINLQLAPTMAMRNMSVVGVRGTFVRQGAQIANAKINLQLDPQ